MQALVVTLSSVIDEIGVVVWGVPLFGEGRGSGGHLTACTLGNQTAPAVAMGQA